MSAANLVNEMHERRSVLNGWAAVLSLSQRAVSALVQARWDTGKPVCLTSREGNSLTQVSLTLDAPDVTFSDGDAVEIRIPVRAASVRQGTLPDGLPEGAGRVAEEAVAWSPLRSVSCGDDFVVTGKVPLVMTGDDSPEAWSLSLDFGGASFSVAGADRLASSEERMGSSLSTWFAAQNIRPGIVAYRFSPSADGRQICPTRAAFSLSSREGRRALHLCLATDATPSASTPTSLASPVVDDEDDFSLIIDSRIVIDDVVSGFNSGMGRLKLDAVSAPVSRTAGDDAGPQVRFWYARTAHPLVYDGTVDTGGVFPVTQNHAELGMDFLGSTSDGLVIEDYTTPESNIRLSLSVDGSFPLVVTGEGKDQKIGFTSAGLAVTEGGMIESVIKPQLEAFLFGEIKPNMTSFTFDPVATMLLSHFIFDGFLPAIHGVQLPGDLLVTGTLDAFSDNAATQ
jgi:hypothetical protein